MGADCKSAGERLRRFESYTRHQTRLRSSGVEHPLGKGKVTSSNLVEGSIFLAVGRWPMAGGR